MIIFTMLFQQWSTLWNSTSKIITLFQNCLMLLYQHWNRFNWSQLKAIVANQMESFFEPQTHFFCSSQLLENDHIHNVVSTLKIITLSQNCLMLLYQHWNRQHWFNIVPCCKFQHCFNIDLTIGCCDIISC